jgi:hypothetical protein
MGENLGVPGVSRGRLGVALWWLVLAGGGRGLCCCYTGLYGALLLCYRYGLRCCGSGVLST